MPLACLCTWWTNRKACADSLCEQAAATPKIRTRYSHGTPTALPRYAHGTPTVRPRHSRSTPVVTLPVAGRCYADSAAYCALTSTTLPVAGHCAQLCAAMLSFTPVARNYLAVLTLCDCGKFAIFAWRLPLRKRAASVSIPISSRFLPQFKAYAAPAAKAERARQAHEGFHTWGCKTASGALPTVRFRRLIQLAGKGPSHCSVLPGPIRTAPGVLRAAAA